jgi:hypothetical protein
MCSISFLNLSSFSIFRVILLVVRRGKICNVDRLLDNLLAKFDKLNGDGIYNIVKYYKKIKILNIKS